MTLESASSLRVRSRQTLALLVALTVAALQPAIGADDVAALGRRIYEQGIGVDGEPLRAISAGNSQLVAETAACTACHRRSGMGSREGRVAVSPVTGPILYARATPFWPSRPGRAAQSVLPLRQESRSAYDDASLARAIRHGLDPDGRPLDALMPRYALSAQDMLALRAHLRGLSAAPVRGWEPGMLHLATVVTPDADPVLRDGVTASLAAWARSSRLRGAAIDLQVWTLEGPPDGWRAQLQRLEQGHPVYAVISGAGGGDWAPVRDFCEHAGLPCLFPIVDLAPSDPGDFYTMYLSRGVPLEARLLARHFADRSPRPERIVQLVGGPVGAAAAQLLAAELDGLPNEVRAWRAESAGTALEGLQAGDALVAWLGTAQLRALAAAKPQGLGVAEIVVSAQLAAPGRVALPPAWQRDILWVSARSDPQQLHGKAVLGLLPWAAQLKLPLDEEAVMAEVYAATYFFADALARMRGHTSREFLLETLEGAHFARPAGSAFYSLSLGPGQREAAKGGHLLGHGGRDGQQIVTVGARLTP